jgi:hypothetical protein
MRMRKRRTRDEALVELNGFSPEDREAFDLIRNIRDRRRAAGQPAGRLDVRGEARCGTALVVLCMAILEALEGSEGAGDSSEVDPPVPPEVAVMAAEGRASVDRAEKGLSEAVKVALMEERERVRSGFEARLNDAAHTIERLHAHITDFEETAEAAAIDLREQTKTNLEQTAALAVAVSDRDRLNEEVTVLTAANGGMAEKLVTVTTEISDVRALNAVLSEQLVDIKLQLSVLKGQASELEPVRVELVRVTEERDGRYREIQQLQAALSEAREEHRLEISRLREDNDRQLAEARRRITELEQLSLNKVREPV